MPTRLDFFVKLTYQ